LRKQSKQPIMKYLITGGTGFLGRGIADNLLANGHKIRVLDSNFRGNSKLLESHRNLEIIQGDIRDRQVVIEAAKGVDSILHLAFINGTRYFYEKPNLVVEVGIRGMLNIAESAKINSIDEIILVSTSEVYQSPREIPTPENVPLVIPDILNPRYSYGGAKIASELILVNMCSEFLKNWKIVRPHNIYGPNMGNEHVIPALIHKIRGSTGVLDIQGDGMQMRSFCHISDFVNAFDLILKDKNKNQIYHVGTTDEISIKELAELLTKLMQKPLKFNFGPNNLGETLRRCPSIKKIEQLGFQPKIQLQEGLEKMINL
jgi:UDP-glucose 4-epimerase